MNKIGNIDDGLKKKRKNNHYRNVNSFIKNIMLSKIKLGDKVIDATIGNGNDIAFMLNIIGKEGYAYGFDVQKIAIYNTTNKISEVCGEDTKNYELFDCGHQYIIDKVNEEIDFVVFNLGYLPKSDHNVITKSYTTIKAIDSSLKLLKTTGCICIAAYIGHDGGMEEYNELKDYLSNLEQSKYCVSNIKYINLINNPPEIFVIEKR